MKGIFKATGYFMLYFFITMLFQTLFSISFMGIGAINGLRDEKLITEFANNNILGITIFSGIFTILFFYIIFKKKNIKKEWKLNKFKMKNIILPIILSFSYSFLFALVTYNISIENSVMITTSVKYYNELFPMLGFLLMSINLFFIAPISEEIALRGIVYTNAEKANNGIIAIIVSSLLFGFMHFSAGGGILVIGAILMGAVFGYIFYRYNSLFVCIVCHSFANLPDFILFKHTNISNGLLLGLKICFIIIFIISFVLIEKNKNIK